MKKTYMQPTIEVALIELQSMIANSTVTGNKVDTEEDAGENVAGLSRHTSSIWGDEDEEY